MRDFDFRMIFDDFGEEPGQRGPGSVGQRWVELGRDPHSLLLPVYARFIWLLASTEMFSVLPLAVSELMRGSAPTRSSVTCTNPSKVRVVL